MPLIMNTRAALTPRLSTHTIAHASKHLLAPKIGRPLFPSRASCQTIKITQRCRAHSDSDEDEEDADEVELLVDAEDFEFEDEFLNEEDGSVRLYLDSADVNVWEKWAETGLFYGMFYNL
jgi:hypothetical protein